MKLQHEREMYFMKINSSNNIATTITNKRNEVRCVRVYRPSGCWSGISLVCCVLGVWRVVLVARSRHIANCSIRMPIHIHIQDGFRSHNCRSNGNDGGSHTHIHSKIVTEVARTKDPCNRLYFSLSFFFLSFHFCPVFHTIMRVIVTVFLFFKCTYLN